MQFISWKTCRRAKGGRTSCLVSLHQPLLSMLYLGSFHPPADRRVYMGPLVKDPRHSHPESFHSAPSSSRLRGRSDRPNKTGSYDAIFCMCTCMCVFVHDCVTVITTVCSCVNIGFVLHTGHYKYLQCSTSKYFLSERMCYNEILELSGKTDYSGSRIKQFITAILFITID